MHTIKTTHILFITLRKSFRCLGPFSLLLLLCHSLSILYAHSPIPSVHSKKCPLCYILIIKMDKVCLSVSLCNPFHCSHLSFRSCPLDSSLVLLSTPLPCPLDRSSTSLVQCHHYHLCHLRHHAPQEEDTAGPGLLMLLWKQRAAWDQLEGQRASAAAGVQRPHAARWGAACAFLRTGGE